MARAVRTPQAKSDLVDILAYIGERNRVAARRLAKELTKLFNPLARFPLLGRDRQELAPGLKSYPLGNFVVFYRPMKAGIEVIRVLHGARDIPPLFQD
jgi:toxin ParE1/3/4